MSAAKKGGLGRGLDAIFMDNDTEDQNSTVVLRISEIEPNRDQPRKDFDEESLAELADSISQHGLLQPILVRPLLGGGYQIVAGERRYRACRMAGVSEVPVMIRELDDTQVMELALIENLQREDLTIIEEALGYKTLIDKYDLTQEQVAKSVGKSRSAITNTLRLLSLPQKVLGMLNNNQLSAGHARALLAIEDKDDIEKIADVVVNQGLSVRELEKLVKKISKEESDSKLNTKGKEKNQFFREMEIALNAELCRKVVISGKENKGTIQIDFYNKEELCDLARRLAGEK